jgi:hypothetical protein
MFLVPHVQSPHIHLAMGSLQWIAAAAIDRGKLFRRVNKVGRTWGDGMTAKYSGRIPA